MSHHTPHGGPVPAARALVRAVKTAVRGRGGDESAPTVPPPGKWALPEGVFPHIADAYAAHDETCASLPYFWLAHRGGVSCLSDLDPCTGCGVTFYNEGLAWVNYADEDAEDEIRLCGCCATKAGYLVQMGRYGLTLIEDASVADG